MAPTAALAVLFSACVPALAQAGVTKYNVVNLGPVTPVAITDHQVLVRYSQASGQAFGLWKNGRVQGIGLRNVVVWGLNDRGNILVDRDGSWGIFRRGRVEKLGRNFSGVSGLHGLNDRDETVGVEANGRPVLVGPGRRLALRGWPDPPGDFTCLNNRRQVVGVRLRGRRIVVFIWQAQKVTPLSDPDGRFCFPTSINGHGRVVGEAEVGTRQYHSRHAVLWVSGKMVDLNSKLVVPGWELNAAIGINDRGEVLGSGLYHGRRSAFLLVPAGR